jgi:hypothetical protein
MHSLHQQRDEDTDPINLEELGKGLNISSTGEEMRLLECPKCERLYIREHTSVKKFAICVCGVRIQLKQRWYD